MLVAILLVLVLFWLLGYGPFQVLHLILLKFNGLAITLWDILIFLALIWLIGSLPSPFRQIAVVFILIWILSLLGVIAVAGLSSILVIAIIIGVLLYILSGGR
ncbi:MAG TPA: hypothetical protein VL401_03005 [Alphaproteobacteria bacterium]|jgi:hypothetical protein|nr:hypothetical protein [Alphaproteobacteria bacterium]